MSYYNSCIIIAFTHKENNVFLFNGKNTTAKPLISGKITATL